MNSVCRISQQSFKIEDKELSFLKEISPGFGGSLMEIPPPTCSPQTRLMQMLAFRNERVLYQTKCEHSGDNIISGYSPDSNFKVYSKDVWWDDFWDACDFGVDFDFSKTFSDNFRSLISKVPKTSLYQKNCENSDYNNFAHNLKNCYLNFGSTNSEDCYYTKNTKESYRCFDSLNLSNCELCLEGIYSYNCYNCQFFRNCFNCSDSFLIEDCTGCKNCFLCYGLKSAEYHILNKKVSKKEFEQFKSKWFPLDSTKLNYLKKTYQELLSKIPRKAVMQISTNNSTGHALLNSNEVQNSYGVRNGEGSNYIFSSSSPKHCYDVAHGSPDGNEFCYRIYGGSGTNSSAFCFTIWDSSSAYYSTECFSSHNIFGCTGIRRKRNCILNKSYSKKEYDIIVKKIINHMVETKEWGEYLSPEISCFAYNESVASEYFPLKKSEALNLNYKWSDKLPSQNISKDQSFSNSPSSAKDIKKEISKEVFRCSKTKKAYRFTPQEISYYKESGIPLSHLCPDQRHLERLQSYPSVIFKKRKCSVTNEDLVTNILKPSVNLISPEAFLEYDYTDIPKEINLKNPKDLKLNKKNKVEKKQTYTQETSVLTKKKTSKDRSLTSLDELLPEINFSSLIKELKSTNQLESCKSNISQKALVSIYEKLSLALEKNKLDKDFILLPSSSGAIFFLVHHISSLRKEPGFKSFDLTAYEFLSSFLFGLLNPKAKGLRPIHLGPLLEIATLLSAAEWQLIIEINSLKNTTILEISKLCTASSQVMAEKLCSQLINKNLLIKQKSKRYHLSDLAELICRILKLDEISHA